MITKANSIVPKPTVQAKSNAKKPTSSTNGSLGRAKVIPNQRITSFFKKAEPVDQGLFISGGASNEAWKSRNYEDDGLVEELYEAPERYHENGGSVKKRKTSDIHGQSLELPVPTKEYTPPLEDEDVTNAKEIQTEANQNDAMDVAISKKAGPFLEDSDSESENQGSLSGAEKRPIEVSNPLPEQPDGATILKEKTTIPNHVSNVGPSIRDPPIADTIQDFEGFENIGEFQDQADEGEEYRERVWMEKQAQIEMEDGLLNSDIIDPTIEGLENVDVKEEEFDDLPETTSVEENAEPSCPICNISLAGASDQDASVHVNNCLDGNPSSLPRRESPTNSSLTNGTHKLRRPIRPAKPGQQNPFTLTPSTGESKSAFTQLMTNHAEDLAWKTAAASEVASRGKPAYQRTCPFYKILPGFSICVDAFRYGAVQGCQAYFLSHFHSDHYIGLTANWCHGPIYCSRVTANLVRKQLRVDPKCVIDLEWEHKSEVSGTNGVMVTMLPANHCPGSSLFLFEKVIGRGNNPKMQRVLHCGDFRACRAHIEHPLLRPDIVDTLSGKTKEQKIDICYLDTTYLNPKYAFPTQEDVIKACADMCVSLNGEHTDRNDDWETMKRENAGSTMVKFLENGSKTAKQEELNSTDGYPIDAPRCRLLVVVGTYSIGKERICLGIAKALNSKIYAPPAKQRICACLEDSELMSRLTPDPREAQVHMTPLFEIRAETLDEYLKDFRDAFTRAVGFRPTGWNYRPPNSRFIESPSVQTVLYSQNWKSNYSVRELTPQRGSTKRAACFGVPYSEHSSFRELTMFCCALRIERIIPTVNVGSAKSRERMRSWVEKWMVERKKGGLFKPEEF